MDTNTKDEPDLARSLRMARTGMGLTQEELSDRSGVAVQTIRMIEYGRVVDPRMSTMKSLAGVLGEGWEQAA